jgi:hypothetical protein
MNIQLDYPEVWAARQNLLDQKDLTREQWEAETDSLIDACFRRFASSDDRRDMASTNYSRARALLAHATHQMTEEEYNTPGNSILLGVGHALLAVVEGKE